MKKRRGRINLKISNIAQSTGEEIATIEGESCPCGGVAPVCWLVLAIFVEGYQIYLTLVYKFYIVVVVVIYDFVQNRKLLKS